MKILGLIDTYKPDIILFEDLRSMQNAQTVRKLFKFTGIIEEIAQTLQIKYCECLTVSVRAKLCETKTGPRGNGTKFDLCKMLCKKYDWEYPVDKKGNEVTNKEYWFFNISDAVGNGIYWLRYLSKKNMENKNDKIKKKSNGKRKKEVEK